MYTIMYEMNRQSVFNTGYRMLAAGARGRSKEMIWGGRWEGGSGLGTHVYPWRIHVNVWQKQYSIVKQNKSKIKIKKYIYMVALTLRLFYYTDKCFCLTYYMLGELLKSHFNIHKVCFQNIPLN